MPGMIAPNGEAVQKSEGSVILRLRLHFQGFNCQNQGNVPEAQAKACLMPR
jgi:hypothetical protein